MRVSPAGQLGWPHPHRLILSLVLLGLVSPALAQSQYLEEFEAGRPSWQPQAADVPYNLVDHHRTQQAAYTGEFGERISLTAGDGTFIYFSHRIGQARLLEELEIALWLKSNRAGPRLLARVVLPEVADPQSGRPVSVLLPGDVYSTAGRWQQLRLVNPLELLERQRNVLRAQLRRDVELAGVYVDRIYLNVYAGSGETEVLIDDLSIQPFVGQRPSEGRDAAPAASQPSAPSVELRHDGLWVDGTLRFLRMIRHRGEPLPVLKAAGFNAVWFEEPTAEVLQQARELDLGVIAPPPLQTDAPSLQANEGQTLPKLDDTWNPVWIWYLGSELDARDIETTSQQARWLRRSDPHKRPITADVRTDLPIFSREFDLVGIHRWLLFGAMDLRDYRQWLMGQGRLARAGTLLWSWVQTQPPSWCRELPATRLPAQPGGSPDTIVPLMEPEQIWLAAYSAIAAGYRGLGFWSEQPLSHSQRRLDHERLLSLALLNLELRLIEPWLAGGDYLGIVPGNPSSVEAAVFRNEWGILLIPVWHAPSAEFVPDQQAAESVSLVVPGVPEASAVWEISPTSVQPLERQRVSGGLRLTLEEFDLTSMVLFSNDQRLVAHLQRQIARSQSEAARLRRDLAAAKYQRTQAIDRQLRFMGHPQRVADRLLEQAAQYLGECDQALARGDYALADQSARRAMRAMRILQRSHWEEAVADLSHPAESPYALCFNTLPEHWRFRRLLDPKRLGPNLMESGNFEEVFHVTGQGWRQSRLSDEQLNVQAELSPTKPRSGQYSLRLAVAPHDPKNRQALIPGTPLEVFAAPVSAPSAGWLEISGWVRIPQPLRGGIEGVWLAEASADAVGPRWKRTQGWQPFRLYRPARRDGTLQLMLTLDSFGEVYFDDLSVRALPPIGAEPTPPTARRQ